LNISRVYTSAAEW